MAKQPPECLMRFTQKTLGCFLEINFHTIKQADLICYTIIAIIIARACLLINYEVREIRIEYTMTCEDTYCSWQ